MSEQRAEQLIVVSFFVLLASEVGNYLVTKQQGGHLSAAGKKGIGRRIVGGFLTMFFASLVAMAAPEVGALLAIAVASYAFFHDGLPAINRPYAKQEQRESLHGERIPGTTPGPYKGLEPLGEASPIFLPAAEAAIMA